MQYHLKSNGVKIILETKAFASGGEGELFRIQSPPEYKSYIVKRYYKNKRNRAREDKLSYLIEQFDVNSTNAVAGVKDIVLENGNVCGFIQDFREGESLEILCSLKLPKRFIKDWKMYSLSSSMNLSHRLKIAYNLARVVEQIHRQKVYRIVDLKPDNILVTRDAEICIVDVDSLTIIHNNKALFEHKVATPEYSPATNTAAGKAYLEYAWDNFSLAVILYKLLLGIHPFAASSQGPYVNMQSIKDKIQEGLYVHNKNKAYAFTVIPPPHKAFDNLPLGLQELFNQCFITGHFEPQLRPTAMDWVLTIYSTLHQIADKHMLKGVDSPNYQITKVFTMPSQLYREQGQVDVLIGINEEIKSMLGPLPKPIFERRKSIEYLWSTLYGGHPKEFTLRVGVLIFFIVSATFQLWLVAVLILLYMNRDKLRRILRNRISYLKLRKRLYRKRKQVSKLQRKVSKRYKPLINKLLNLIESLREEQSKYKVKSLDHQVLIINRQRAQGIELQEKQALEQLKGLPLFYELQDVQNWIDFRIAIEDSYRRKKRAVRREQKNAKSPDQFVEQEFLVDEIYRKQRQIFMESFTNMQIKVEGVNQRSLREYKKIVKQLPSSTTKSWWKENPQKTAEKIRIKLEKEINSKMIQKLQRAQKEYQELLQKVKD